MNSAIRPLTWIRCYQRVALKPRREVAKRLARDYSKVQIGGFETTVPRHGEINELTAKGIIRYFERRLSE